MIEIKKGKSPNFLIKYGKEPLFETLTSEDKATLRSHLLNDQGYLCAYCMCRIKGENDTKIEQVSIAVGHQMFIGYSCNTPEQVERANTMDFVDYIGCGPVFPTKSKPDADAAIGINRLERLNMISERPVVAIGGIDEENMKVVHDTGVAGLAVISLVFDSKDLAATVKKMKNLYKSSRR